MNAFNRSLHATLGYSASVLLSLLCVGLAAAVALAGYGRALGGPLHGPVDHLLDGSLAPFRNVYKLEPVIAAALALGLAHAVATWLARHPGRQATTLQRIYTLEARAVVGVVLIGLMLPYLSGQVLNPGSFSAVPRYWYQVAAYLADRSPQNTHCHCAKFAATPQSLARE